MASMHTLFPLLFPLSADQSCFDGFIKVKDKEFRLRIEVPKGKSLKNLRLYGDWQLQHYLQGYESLVKARLQSVPDVKTFLEELQNILQSTVNSSESSDASLVADDLNVFPQIMQDIDDVGWHRVTYVDSSFRKLQFICQDSAGRQHSLQVNIPLKYPQEAPDCSADLPESFVPQWSSKSSLTQLVQEFEQFTEKFNDLWLQFDEIDEKTVVIEPEKPRKSDVFRRIALGNNASIQMTLNPSHPRSYPDCRFLGASHVVTPLKEKLQTGILSWDETSTVLANMQKILILKFPEPSSQSRQEFSEECGICYTYRLESGIPDAVCENNQCSKPFHQSCLYEWLRSLPTGNHMMSKPGFNKASGDCPYCGKLITVQKPD